MALKAVIFDLFGTLTVRTMPEHRIIEKWKLDPKLHPVLVRAICGQKFENWESYIDKVVETAGIEASKANKKLVREIIDSRIEIGIKGVFPEAKNVLLNLKEKGYVLGLVSDCCPHSRKILEKTGVLGFFKEKAVVLSYEIGMVKWDREIYNVCLEGLGVKAEATAMVGDSLNSDIEMSKQATNGKIHGILVSDSKPKAGFATVSSLAEVPKAVEALGGN